MRMPWKTFIFAWFACAGVLLAVGCGGNEKSTAPAVRPAGGAAGSTGDAGEKRIIIITNGDSPFWTAARVGLQEAETELNLAKSGLRASLEINNSKPQGQIDLLRQYATQSDIVGIGISPVVADNVAVAEEMSNLRKKGVHVITVDSDVDRARFRDARYAFIGTDNLAGGRELGKCTLGLRPEGGQYVTFVGHTGAQNALDRVQGVRQGAGPRV